MRLLGPSTPTPPPPAVPVAFNPSSVPAPADGQPSPFSLPPASASLAWPTGIDMTMHVHLSTLDSGNVFANKPNKGVGLPHFKWENITFGNWNEKRVMEFDVTLPKSVQENASLWADIILVRNDEISDPSQANFNPASVYHVRKLLTRYLPKLKVRKEKNLLGNSVDSEDDAVEGEEPEQDVIISHWHKNLTIALVSDNVVIPYAQLPPPVAEHVHLLQGYRDETGTKGFYQPVVFPNDFWNLRSQYIEINETTPVLPLRVVLQPLSYWKFQLYATMGHGFNEAAKQQGGAGHAEMDELKRMLVETNPWFLGLTALVSMLHVLFEMLAFKSDVSHWRKKEELTGVSVRWIITNVFVQIVILLYLLDNNEQTSWMILMGQGVGILIEAWKVTKAVDIKIIPTTSGFFPYKVDVKDKHVLSDDEKKTQEYDKLAFKYVSYVAFPTLAGYTIYSLLYKTHRGWYSFVISTLTSFVYMFGFAQLIPQLIINYKLKSVAHMPMKAMIYKTLSTVVDDFFAFCIKMPFLHRLACFRDDVVFLIFLYQRWIYRVDPNRVNEYGQVMATGVELQETAEGKQTRKKESKKTK
ncbi:cleft lip and palate transmembrane 1 [Rickenella mellea]|uniref:Cleft lip and palate transmembrane 1 n=1 Tax=Rickenella mellea TaxID=50990 RepID=A0A4V3AZK5_9AGAM|nr:cleft lip and palate transmembrane 1 [Rickenella mellea]